MSLFSASLVAAVLVHLSLCSIHCARQCSVQAACWGGQEGHVPHADSSQPCSSPSACVSCSACCPLSWTGKTHLHTASQPALLQSAQRVRCQKDQVAACVQAAAQPCPALGAICTEPASRCASVCWLRAGSLVQQERSTCCSRCIHCSLGSEHSDLRVRCAHRPETKCVVRISPSSAAAHALSGASATPCSLELAVNVRLTVAPTCTVFHSSGSMLCAGLVATQTAAQRTQRSDQYWKALPRQRHRMARAQRLLQSPRWGQSRPPPCGYALREGKSALPAAAQRALRVPDVIVSAALWKSHRAVKYCASLHQQLN